MPEIGIRPTISSDLSELTGLEHSYQTTYVWQMERSVEDGQISVGFREIRLPRKVRVEYPRSPELIHQEWSQRLEMLTATLQEMPVGYIRLEDHFSPSTAWVTDLVVRENVRRQGIATALLLAAQQWSTQRDLRRMVISLQSKNFPAIRLALKLGYEFCGYNDHFYANRDIALFFARFLR